VIAALAAYEARDSYGERWDDLLIECARYAAASRQPWSEPPILDPPPFDAGERRDVEALRDAVAARDRLAAERWLAARLDDDPEPDLFTVAADNFDDLGMKVIVTAAATKLSKILGEKGRYAALRIAVSEMTANASGGQAPPPVRTGEAPVLHDHLRSRLVNNALAEKGSIESVQAVFLYDAAKDTNVFDRVCGYLATLPVSEAPPVPARRIEPPIYQLARDYGQHLRAFASGDEQLMSATAYNLEKGPSFADWSFA
jgi:hypothetical protein